MTQQTYDATSQFQAYVHCYSQYSYSPTLRSSWRLNEDELAPLSAKHFEILDSRRARQSHTHLAWIHHAIQEFQDLQFIALGIGPYPNNSRYLFYEALSALREAVVSGLNNSFHASLTMMRSVLELFIFDAWWRTRLDSASSWTRFEAWTAGEHNSPPFKNVVNAVYKDLLFPQDAMGEQSVTDIYEYLCSYTHKPVPAESITRIRKANMPMTSEPLLQMWFFALHAVSLCMLDLLIAQYPLCLFPLCPYRKFGFNPPVGVYFDKDNFVPLGRSLNQRKSPYKEFYRKQEQVTSLLNFYNHRPDLTEYEVLQSWWKDSPPSEKSDDTLKNKLQIRWMLLKAEVRAMNWAFAYGKDFQKPELRQLLERAREGSRLSATATRVN